MSKAKLRDKRLYWRGDVIWCRVLGASGRIERHTTKCRTEEAAVARANELERRAADPTYAASAATTIGGVAQDLITDLRRRKKSADTIKIARQKLGHAIRIWGADLPLLRVTARLVLEYVDKRQGEGVSDYTIKKELRHLAMALKLARHLGTFHEDVARVMPPFFTGGHKPRQRWATQEEFEKLVAELEPHRAAHVLFIVATGARLGESLRAERSDVDLDRRVVHVRGTKTAKADDVVYVTSVSEPYLRRALKGALASGPMFSRWGKVVRDLAAACRRAGIEKLSPNDLRRTFGHWHRLAGVNVAEVAKLLRHTTDKLAQTTYANASSEALGGVIESQIRAVSKTYANATSTAPGGARLHEENTEKDGAPGETRTHALRLRRPGDSHAFGTTKLESPDVDDDDRVSILYAAYACREFRRASLRWMRGAA